MVVVAAEQEQHCTGLGTGSNSQEGNCIGPEVGTPPPRHHRSECRSDDLTLDNVRLAFGFEIVEVLP